MNLDPTVGAETRKKHPCVILQSDMVNRKSRTVIVAPILPNHKRWPFAVNVTPSERNGLDKDRHINVKQLRSVDVSRVGNFLGLVETRDLDAIKEAIEIFFGL